MRSRARSPRSCASRFVHLGLAALLLAPAAAVGAEAEAEAEAEPAAAPARYDGFDGTPCAQAFDQYCGKAAGSRAAYECVRIYAKRGAASKECLEHTEQIRRARLEEAIARQKLWQEGCAQDIQELCAEFADEPPKTVKGCLNRKRAELSEACNEKLPVRGSYRGRGDARWKDGSEPEDWDLQQAMKNRPRKTAEMLAEQEREAERARQREEIRAAHEARRAARKAAAAAKEAGAAVDGDAAQGAAAGTDGAE